MEIVIKFYFRRVFCEIQKIYSNRFSSDSALEDLENQEIVIPEELRTHEVARVILDSETPEECVNRLLGLTQETKTEFLRQLVIIIQKERSEQ